MKALLAPLTKISDLIEEEKKLVDKIHHILAVDLKQAATQTHIELKRHTLILGEIRDLLKLQLEQQLKQQTKESKPPSIKMPGIIGGIKAGFAIVTMAAAIVAASKLMSNISVIEPSQFLTALAIGSVFIILTPMFIEISNSLKGEGLYERIVGKLMKVNSNASNTKSLMSNLAGTGLAMFIMATAVTASSYVLTLITEPSLSQLATAFLIGLTMIPMAYTFNGFAKSIYNGGFTPDASGLKRMGMTALAMVLIAGALSGMAWALQSMPPQLLEPPELDWIFSTGIMLWIYSKTFGNVVTSIKGLSLKEMVFGSLAMPLLAMTVMGVAYALSKMPATFQNPPPLEWTLKTGLALFVFSRSFLSIMKEVKRASKKELGLGVLVLTLLAASIVGIAWIFNYLSKVEAYNAPPVEWTLAAGLALFVFSFSFRSIMKAAKGVSKKDLGLGVLALSLLAAGILGVAWVFNYLSEVEAYNAPPVEWTLAAGLALFTFGITFALITAIIKVAKIGIKELILGTVAVAAVGLAILGVAWIFSILPDEYTPPPLEWAMESAIAITVFAIPVMLLSAFIVATGGTGALALLGGIIGIVLIAGAMWAVAWIFSMMPDLSSISKNITNALMVPVNAMVDILKRFKDEIGIENLLPLAGGLVAVAGGWLALVGALAGQSIGGLASSIANLGTAIYDGISSLFGGSKTQTPIDLLDALISREPGITKLIKPMKQIGSAFQTVSMATPLVIKGISAFGKFLVEDNAENFERSAKASTELAKAYTKFSAASKTMNVKAIQASTQMFNALTKLAEADGEDAMTVLADKLLQAVKELSEITVDLQEAITAQGAATTGVGDVISGALGKVTEVVTAATDKAKKMVGDAKTDAAQIDLQPVVEALEEIKDRFDMPIYTKEITL